MKKSLIRAILTSMLAILIMVSCNLLPGGTGKAKVLSADDAKVEIRAANQEIMGNKDVMLDAPGMKSLSFMLELLGGVELKSAVKSVPIYSRKMTYSKALNFFRGNLKLKSATIDDDDDESFYGIYEYDFDLDELVLLEESTSMMQINYPADETALANQQNNAQLTISNLEFDEIASYDEEYDWETGAYEMVETTESIPVSADVVLTVDTDEVLTADYSASYNSEGMPTSMSAEMDSGDYTFSMSYSGNSTKYSTKLEYKMGNEDLMGYDLDVVYTADMETVESINGYYLLSPLKFEGSISGGAISDSEMDGEMYVEPTNEEMNSQLDVDVIQVNDNVKIGTLEYQMYYDSEWEESYPMLAIVYGDGTSEWLDEVMTVMDIDMGM